MKPFLGALSRPHGDQLRAAEHKANMVLLETLGFRDAYKVFVARGPSGKGAVGIGVVVAPRAVPGVKQLLKKANLGCRVYVEGDLELVR